MVNHTPQLSTYDKDVRNQGFALFCFILALIAFLCHTALIVCLRERVSVACRVLSLAAESMIDMPYLVFYPIGATFFPCLLFGVFAVWMSLTCMQGTSSSSSSSSCCSWR